MHLPNFLFTTAKATTTATITTLAIKLMPRRVLMRITGIAVTAWIKVRRGNYVSISMKTAISCIVMINK